MRNGSSIPRKIVEKEDNKWVELNPFGERLVRKTYGEKLDAERDRKAEVILNLIRSESLKGNLYTNNQFAEKFENKEGLGYIDSISRRISVLSTKGFIKFNRNFSELGISNIRSKYGILCVESMKFTSPDNKKINIFQTHYKSPNIGTVLEINGPVIWPTNNDEDDV